jgi:hypothetical protein
MQANFYSRYVNHAADRAFWLGKPSRNSDATASPGPLLVVASRPDQPPHLDPAGACAYPGFFDA